MEEFFTRAQSYASLTQGKVIVFTSSMVNALTSRIWSVQYVSPMMNHVPASNKSDSWLGELQISAMNIFPGSFLEDKRVRATSIDILRV